MRKNLAASEACAACGNFKATTVDAGHRLDLDFIARIAYVR